MAVIAPRILFRARGKSMRREAVMGSFTGAAVCAAAGGVAVWAHPEATYPQTQIVAKINVTRARFIMCLLTLLLCVLSVPFLWEKFLPAAGHPHCGTHYCVAPLESRSNATSDSVCKRSIPTDFPSGDQR